MGFSIDWGSTFLWGQLIGFFGIIMNVIVLQIKEPKNIILAYIPTNLVWTISFLMVGGTIGPIVSIAYIFRDSCFSLLQKKHHKYVVYLMLTSAIFLGFYQYQEIFDCFPLIAMVVFNIGFFFKEKRPIWARCSLTNSVCYVIYNMHVGSLAALISCILSAIFSIIGMYRHENWNLHSSPINLFRSLLTISPTHSKEAVHV